MVFGFYRNLHMEQRVSEADSDFNMSLIIDKNVLIVHVRRKARITIIVVPIDIDSRNAPLQLTYL